MFAFVTMNPAFTLDPSSDWWVILMDAKEITTLNGFQESSMIKEIRGIKVGECLISDALPTREIRGDVPVQYTAEIFQWTLYNTWEQLITENLMEVI